MWMDDQGEGGVAAGRDGSEPSGSCGSCFAAAHGRAGSNSGLQFGMRAELKAPTSKHTPDRQFQKASADRSSCR